MRQSLSLVVMLLLTALFWTTTTARAQQEGDAGPWQTYDTSDGEWRSYAGDVGGKKYSPLDQIDAGNFADLELVLGVDVGRPPRQQDDAGRRGVVGAARRHRRGARRGDARPLPHRPPAESDRLPGHAADGRRSPLLQHAAVAGRRRRREDGRDALGLQSQELRRGDDDDDRDVAPAGRRLLDRRRGGRAHLLGHRQRLRRLRGREDRPAVRRLRDRRQRHGRRDGRPFRGPPGASATT